MRRAAEIGARSRGQKNRPREMGSRIENPKRAPGLAFAPPHHAGKARIGGGHVAAQLQFVKLSPIKAAFALSIEARRLRR